MKKTDVNKTIVYNRFFFKPFSYILYLTIIELRTMNYVNVSIWKNK